MNLATVGPRIASRLFRGFWTRIWWKYVLQSFSAVALLLFAGLALTGFGLLVGLWVLWETLGPPVADCRLGDPLRRAAALGHPHAALRDAPRHPGPDEPRVACGPPCLPVGEVDGAPRPHRSQSGGRPRALHGDVRRLGGDEQAPAPPEQRRGLPRAGAGTPPAHGTPGASRPAAPRASGRPRRRRSSPPRRAGRPPAPRGSGGEPLGGAGRPLDVAVEDQGRVEERARRVVAGVAGEGRAHDVGRPPRARAARRGSGRRRDRGRPPARRALPVDEGVGRKDGEVVAGEESGQGRPLRRPAGDGDDGGQGPDACGS